MSLFGRLAGKLTGGNDIDAIVAKKDFNKLVKALSKGKDDRTKMMAAYALGEMGDARAFAPLAAALSDGVFYQFTTAGDALAKVGGEKAIPYLLAAMARHDCHPMVAKSALQLLGEKAFPSLLAHYRRADSKFDLAEILVQLGCVAAVPDLKRDLDRQEFAGHNTQFIANFLDLHKDLCQQGETVHCLVCKKQAPVAAMKGGGDNWFCPDPCWAQRGKLLSKGIGKDCPKYRDGFCLVGDGELFCSLEKGNYATDCHVYAIQK